MIYITDYIDDPDIERKILLDRLSVFNGTPVDKGEVEVLLIWHHAVTRGELQKYPKLKAVVRYGVGVDNVDLSACYERGIKVFNNPDYGVDEVSDTAIAMIMALSRNILAYDRVARDLVLHPNPKKQWQENTNKSSKRLSECSLGIIGVGRIGSAVARKMSPVVNSVNFFDPFVPAGYEKALNTERTESLQELLERSDIVTVHVPLSQHTKGMINAAFMKNLKPGAILVNTARGGLIDNLECIHDALASGRLQAVGLDVLPEEPPQHNRSETLLEAWLHENDAFRGRIIVNPHTSYYSPEAFREMRQKAANIALNALFDTQKLNRVI